MATRLTTHHVSEVGSTQNEARRLAASTGEMPLLLVADRQTSGRGRRGRSWLTAPRALACSLVVAPRWETARWTAIPLAAGLAARRAVASATGVSCALEWPNDLVAHDGKVGGILVEAGGEIVVVGLGANLWWPDPPAGVAALAPDDPGPDAAGRIAAAWAQSLLSVLDGDPADWGRDEYRAACSTLGTHVTWVPDGSGLAVDVAADGGLVVETAQGRSTLRSAEVHSVRSATLPPEDRVTGGGPAQ